jgi:ferrous iron transport protein A
LNGDAAFCARLRELGFRESTLIEKLAGIGRRTMLCQLWGTRVALSDQAATYIVVELIRIRP